MDKKKICFVAQFPPPIHGLSKAVQTLYDSELNNEFDFEKIDLTNNKRILHNLWRIFKSRADLFYFTISQTKVGNLRDLLILKLLNIQKKRCVIHLHGGYYRQLLDNDLPKWQKKANYKRLSKISGAIVLGDSLKPIFKDIVDEEKIWVVPNCVDDAYLIDDDAFDEKVNDLRVKKIRHVLYLSNFILSKGYMDVLELAKFEKIRTENNKQDCLLHFDFAGKFFDEKTKKDFFDFINRNSLQNYVTYHGVVTGQEKLKLLEKSNFFVLLTKYPKEGQPISILEAMGNGLFIVSTNHAGIPDIVKDGVNGIVVNRESYSLMDCYNNIIACAQSSFIIKRVAEQNRNFIKNEYSQRNYIDNMEEVFFKCLQ